jgi:hypothetical protein
MRKVMQRNALMMAGPLVLSLAMIAGCGRSESAPPASSAEAAAKPLEGKAASKPSQFVGTWFCTTDGPLTGLEFLKDGKVLVYSSLLSLTQGAQGMMLNYDVLEGGRLSLTAPMGQTDVYHAVLSGDQLELRNSDGEAHRYRRLTAGQTLAEAAKEHQAAIVKRYEERASQLRAFLQRKDLVLIGQSPELGERFAIALELVGQGERITGNAFHEGAVIVPGGIEVIPQINPQSQQSQMQVRLATSSNTHPAGSNVTQGAFRLKVEGTNSDLQITGPLVMNNVSVTAQLKADAARHAKIVDAYKQQQAQAETLKQPIIEALRDYAVLRGTSAVQNSPNQQTQDQIILIRDPNSSTWRGEIQTTNTTTGQTQTLQFMGAGIEVQNGQARLTIVTPGRIYQLGLQGKFTGTWSFSPRDRGLPSELDIIEAADKATYDARIAAQKQALLSIKPTQLFYGLVPANGPNQEVTPVVLTLEIKPDGQIIANANYTIFRSNVLMTGQVADSLIGPTIQLKFKDIPAGQTGVRVSANMLSMKIRHQQWNLRLPDVGPSPRLVGHLSSSGNGTLAFTQHSDTWKAHLDSQLRNALTKGLTWKVVHPSRRDNVEATTLSLKFTDDGKQVAGEIATGGRHLSVPAQSTLAGQLTDAQGWPAITLELTPAGRGSKHSLELIYLEQDGQPRITGVIYPSHAPQATTFLELENVSP